jgi:HD-like signal output (HDOD) protein
MKSTKHRLVDVIPPIMQATAVQLRRLLDRSTTRNPLLQHVLLNDPAAAVAVYRVLGRLRPQACDTVSDAAHAISLIGMLPLQEMIDSLPSLDFDPTQRPLRETAASAYSQAAHAAHYAKALAEHRGLGANHEIPTAALVQNPAVLALWTLDPESAQRATFTTRDGVDFETAFSAELGEPLEDANRRLAEAWSLPALARQAMGDWDDFSSRAQLVELAGALAQTAACGWRNENLQTINVILAEFLDCSEDAAVTWLHRETVAAAAHMTGFCYPLPAFDLPLTDNEDPDQEDDHPLPVFGAWRDKAKEPVAVPQPHERIHETIVDVMRRIRRDADTERVMFAMLNPERSRLRARIALGGSPDDALRRLDLDTSEKNLLSMLLSRQQSVWLHRGNAAKFKPFLRPSLSPLFTAGDAYLMSLFVADRPLGLLFADGRRLSDDGYRRFRALCHEAMQGLAADAEQPT